MAGPRRWQEAVTRSRLIPAPTTPAKARRIAGDACPPRRGGFTCASREGWIRWRSSPDPLLLEFAAVLKWHGLPVNHVLTDPQRVALLKELRQEFHAGSRQRALQLWDS